MAVKRKRKSKSKRGVSARRRIRRRRKAASGAVRRRRKSTSTSTSTSGSKKSTSGRRRRRRVGTGYLQRSQSPQRLRLGAESAKLGGLVAGGLLGYYALGSLREALPKTGNVARFMGDPGRVAVSSVAGLVASYAARYLRQLRSGFLGRMVDGLQYVSVLGLGISAIQGLALTQVGRDAKLNQLPGLVSGPGQLGVSILSSADLEGKIAELRGEREELEGALGSVAGDLTPEQEAVYVSAAEHVASVQGPLDAAAKLLENGRMYEAAEAIKDAMSLAIVARALLSGLTAGAVQQQMPAQQQLAQQQALPQLQLQAAQQAVAQQALSLQQQMEQGLLPAQVQIQNAADGQVITVPAPADEDVVVPVVGGGSGLNLDGLAQWSAWVAQQQPGWAPSEVATAFVLKWLANNQHYFAYGPNAVVSQNNYGPGNLAGYSNVASQQEAPALRLTTGGQVFTCGASQEEVLGTISGIFESHLGSF